MSSARSFVAKMPKLQRDSLVAHIEGPQQIVTGMERFTRQALISRGLLHHDPANMMTSRPSKTALTELGREVVCIILGDYADALVKADMLEQRPQITLWRRKGYSFAPVDTVEVIVPAPAAATPVTIP
jgi:hypothetical protein